MKEIETVAIIGRGALGIMFGQFISQKLGRESLCFIVDEVRKERYQKDTIYCNQQNCDFIYASSEQEFKKVDLILVCVKATGLEAALQQMESFIHQDTIIISTMNGITSETIIKDNYIENEVIRCVAQKMDAVYLDNQVTYQNLGELVIGIEYPRQIEGLQRLLLFFDGIQFPYRIVKDIVHHQWSKLMLNCGVNQVCAAYDVGYQGVQEDGHLRALMVETMKEVLLVANAEGIDLHVKEIAEWLKVVDSLSPSGMPSMRQDVLAHRTTELPLFSETIIKLADKHKIEVPNNKHLYTMIKEIEENYSHAN